MSSATKKISIIIPTYKRDLYLKKLVFNLVHYQIEFPYEIIIVYSHDYDDIVTKYSNIELDLLSLSNTFTTVKFINVNNNITINAKRNLGIKNSTGDFLLFFDDDIDVDKDFIYKLSFLLSKHDAVTGVVFENGNTISLFKKNSFDLLKNLIGHKNSEFDSFTIAVSSGFIAIKKSWFIKYGLLDENYVYSYDDYDLGWRLWMSNHMVFKSSELKIVHFKGDGGSRSRFFDNSRIRMKFYSKAYFLVKHFGRRVAFYSFCIEFIHSILNFKNFLFNSFQILKVIFSIYKGKIYIAKQLFILNNKT